MLALSSDDNSDKKFDGAPLVACQEKKNTLDPLLVEQPFLGKLINLNPIFFSSLNYKEEDFLNGLEEKGNSLGENKVGVLPPKTHLIVGKSSNH